MKLRIHDRKDHCFIGGETVEEMSDKFIAYKLSLTPLEYAEILLSYNAYRVPHTNNCNFKRRIDVKEALKYLESILILQTLMGEV